ncbi:trypsin-like serine peptidase [Actinophytocola gossypii]|uniref:Trypsin-like peptidase domain-containing protein n=1 Tax=Actinophytocola gossypii TaxID=2812003 RepID=A0ABT2J7P1_9PSEU|nr:hypothetical protein [Actinophytocola gossypii]MCT2583874.1 trypsin-like peptidase domain-containing protein [Actinophytocola gossypii]
MDWTPRTRSSGATLSEPVVGVVFPGQPRARVADTTVPPSCWVGRLVTSWPDGSRTWGTATLLDDRHLITCAHNFYNTRVGVGAAQATFWPGLNRDAHGGLVQPYNALPVLRYRVPDIYQRIGGPPPGPGGIPSNEITRYLYDYAVARLGTAISDPPGDSQFDTSWPGTNVVDGLQCTILGYSGDLDTTGCTQYTRSGAVRVDDGENFLLYQMSTYHGDSGAPVFYQPPGRHFWRIVGVHVSGVPSTPGTTNGRNFAVALTEDVIAHLQQMLNQVDS